MVRDPPVARDKPTDPQPRGKGQDRRSLWRREGMVAPWQNTFFKSKAQDWPDPGTYYLQQSLKCMYNVTFRRVRILDPSCISEGLTLWSTDVTIFAVRSYEYYRMSSIFIQIFNAYLKSTFCVPLRWFCKCSFPVASVIPKCHPAEKFCKLPYKFFHKQL